MALNFKPVTLMENIYAYVRTTSMKLMPWERYAILSFDSCIFTVENNNMIKCAAKNSANTDYYTSMHCIIVQLSYLHNRVSFPIAVIYCNVLFDPKTVAFLITGIMHDLLMLGIRIVATVCAPTEQFIKVVSQLCFKTKEQICIADILTYNIGAVGTFGRQVVHIFDFELVLSQIRDIFAKVNFEFEMNGCRSTANFEEVLDFIKHIPVDVQSEFIPSNLSQVKPMRKLFNFETISKMKRQSDNLSSLTSDTIRFCEFFAQTLVSMQKPINPSNKAATHKNFYKTIAVLNSMILIKPKNGIFHSKFIDNITQVSNSIVPDRENKILKDQYSFIVPLKTENGQKKSYANVVPILDNIELTQNYFRCFGLNFANQAVNGVSAIYASLEKHNVSTLKLKIISLISLREMVSSIHKAFAAGCLENLKYTTKMDPEIINIICQAFYNGLRIPDTQT